VGLVWYTVELIDYGLWIVIVWIVRVPGVFAYLFCSLTLEGEGGYVFYRVYYTFLMYGRDLFAVSFMGDMNVCSLVLARSLF